MPTHESTFYAVQNDTTAYVSPFDSTAYYVTNSDETTYCDNAVIEAMDYATAETDLSGIAAEYFRQFINFARGSVDDYIDEHVEDTRSENQIVAAGSPPLELLYGL